MTKEEFDRRLEALLISHEKILLKIDALKEWQQKVEREIKALKKWRRKAELEIKTLKESKRKTHEQIKITDPQLSEMFKKRDEEFKKLKELVAEITPSWGMLPEREAIACFKKIFSNMGILITQIVAGGVHATRNGDSLNLDFFSIGEKNGKKIAIVIAVRSFLKIEDIQSFLKNLERFHDFFEEYRDSELIGGIAFMNPSKNAKAYAEKNGLYLLSLSEDTMTLANSPNFKPKVYRYKLL